MISFRHYLLATVSHDTIARMVPVTPAEQDAIMNRAAQALFGKAWQ